MTLCVGDGRALVVEVGGVNNIHLSEIATKCETICTALYFHFKYDILPIFNSSRTPEMTCSVSTNDFLSLLSIQG